jgi:tRNA/tmRNA/rRNA uracil-C5-methylase (TrmA/RlmC/RlmD family)
MRKFILSLLVVALCFPLGTGLVHADGMLLPEALSPDYVEVRYHRVTVRIEDGHAVTSSRSRRMPSCPAFRRRWTAWHRR